MKTSLPITNRTGLTRIQVLVTLAILCFVGVLATPHVLARQRQAEIEATQATVHAVTQAVIRYSQDHQGKCPTTGESLRSLAAKTQTEAAIQTGPYLEATVQDAWGNDFIYWCPGTFNRDSFDLSSSGSDGVLGNDDDINNWGA
jgi:general secretion pathway protein G